MGDCVRPAAAQSGAEGHRLIEALEGGQISARPLRGRPRAKSIDSTRPEMPSPGHAPARRAALHGTCALRRAGFSGRVASGKATSTQRRPGGRRGIACRARCRFLREEQSWRAPPRARSVLPRTNLDSAVRRRTIAAALLLRGIRSSAPTCRLARERSWAWLLLPGDCESEATQPPAFRRQMRCIGIRSRLAALTTRREGDFLPAGPGCRTLP